MNRPVFSQVRVEEVTLPQDARLSDCARVIRQGRALIALIIDADSRLLGSVTDGDIRRALLAGADMDAPATQAMNSLPITAPIGTPRATCFERMRRNAIFQLPLIDAGGAVRDIVLLAEGAAGANLPNRVVLMAGGLGSRLGSLTESTPKPMLSIGGRPILQGIVERLIASGFRRISISVNYLAEQIEAHFGDGSVLGVEIEYLRETKRLGTAGCLSLLQDAPSEPLVVLNGDVLTDIDLRAMLRYHEENEAEATMALNNYKVDIPYGVVETRGDQIVGLSEKPSYSFFVSAGVYTLSPQALDCVPRDAFYDMPTLFEELRSRGGRISGFPLHEYWLDIGHPKDFDKAQQSYNQVFGSGDIAT